MRREDVLEAVEERLESIPGLRSLLHLEGSFRDQVIEAEKQAEEMGALGGLMPICNEGFWRTMEREEQYALVLDGGTSVISSATNLLQLRDERGTLIGEWLPPDRAEDLMGDERVQFISDDFVLYREVPPEGEPKVVLPEVEFPFLDEVEGIDNVTSASPSGLADKVIRSHLSLPGPGLLSHVVGFDIGTDHRPLEIRGRRCLPRPGPSKR
ncbi:hypothetical protein AOA80_10085 [Methanomassiliicoccales archaeon RumEn M1]|jgi:hypothetical protein|nr:hypothetical protein AOA80_10085 [Methanomassiliicoccales archaeon RumEn M1]